jgi:radical SAM superfamily enzyme YgiQ (UPF0313 family)
LGLLYIKEALSKVKGIKCDLYDTLLSGKVKKISRPLHFDYLKHIYYEDYSYFSLLNNYYRFGDSPNKIISAINENDYNLVIVSALFSAYYNDTEKIINLIKQKTRSQVVVGGWSIKAEGSLLFKNSSADFFLLGNGEYSVPLLVSSLMNNSDLSKVPGLMFRNNNNIIQTNPSKICSLPESFPKRDNSYFFKRKRIAKMVISRGCLFKCKFCTIHRYNNFSARSIESIDNELNYLHKLGVELINFEDDNLFYEPGFSVELIKILKKYHALGLNYSAMNGITAKNILNYIDEIIEAGFIELNLSLVSTNETIISNTNRPFSFNTMHQIIDKINGRIKTLVFLILGLPKSSPQIILNDIIHLAALPVEIGVSPLYLLPDVPDLSRLGLPENRDMLRGSALYKFPDNFSREDIASLWKYVRIINKIKSLTNDSEEIDNENIYYFKKSLKEKNWYRKTKNNEWQKTFSFKIDFPEKTLIKKNDNNFYSL